MSGVREVKDAFGACWTEMKVDGSLKGLMVSKEFALSLDEGWTRASALSPWEAGERVVRSDLVEAEEGSVFGTRQEGFYWVKAGEGMLYMAMKEEDLDRAFGPLTEMVSVVN